MRPERGAGIVGETSTVGESNRSSVAPVISTDPATTILSASDGVALIFGLAIASLSQWRALRFVENTPTSKHVGINSITLPVTTPALFAGPTAMRPNHPARRP